ATIGDPTETALLSAAAHYSLQRPVLDAEFPRLAEVPFSSERKRMTTIHANHDSQHALLNGHTRPYVAFTKGAPDGLLEISNNVYVNGEILPLDAQWRERIDNSIKQLAADGLRVLGVAFKSLETLSETV